MCGVSCAASVTASDSRDVPASGPASTANGSSSAAVDMSGTALAMNSQPFRSLRGYSGRWPACCQRRPGPAASRGFGGSCGFGGFPVPAAALPPPEGCRRWRAAAAGGLPPLEGCRRWRAAAAGGLPPLEGCRRWRAAAARGLPRQAGGNGWQHRGQPAAGTRRPRVSHAASRRRSPGRVAGASLTEAVAYSEGRLLAGITDWCSHPPGLRAARIGGTKNPDIAGIAALAPDLVLANEEENRPADLAALRALGLPVWVTRVRTLGEAFSSLHRMITLAGRLPRPKR